MMLITVSKNTLKCIKDSLTSIIFRLRVVSNFGDVLEPLHPRVYFACPTIAIAKIRDYSQSNYILLYR